MAQLLSTRGVEVDATEVHHDDDDCGVVMVLVLELELVWWKN
jgi:hypothetical protein